MATIYLEHYRNLTRMPQTVQLSRFGLGVLLKYPKAIG